MSFNLNEFTQIVSSIERLLYMSESKPIINISIGYYDLECNRLFRKLSFLLKNGKIEIKIYDDIGVFSYIDINGDILINIKFTDDINGSYQKALNKILAFDRQHVNQLKITEAIERIDILDDRSESNNSPLDEIRKIIAEAT